MTPRVTAVWWLTCILWSSVWLFIKMGVTDVPPIIFAGSRLLIAAVLLLVPAWLHRRSLTLRDHLTIALTGFLLLGLNYALVFWGAQYVSSGMTATLQAAQPAFGMLLGSSAHRRQLSGALIGIIGVAIVSADQLRITGAKGLAGSLAIGGGSACVAYAYTVMKKRLTHVPPIIVLFEQTIVGCVPLLFFGVLLEKNPLDVVWTTRSIVALIYLATAGSVAAFWLNLWLLQRTTAAAVLAMSIVEPLLAVVLGVIVLHERVHGWAAVGAALILLSIRLITTEARGVANSE